MELKDLIEVVYFILLRWLSSSIPILKRSAVSQLIMQINKPSFAHTNWLYSLAVLLLKTQNNFKIA